MNFIWEVFLRICDVEDGEKLGEGTHSGMAAAARAQFSFDRGGALAVLKAVREHVLPLRRKLSLYDAQVAFLVHDRVSGCVPVEEGDRGAFVHVRIFSRWEDPKGLIAAPWFGIREVHSVETTDEGRDRERWEWSIICRQSALVLDVLDRYRDLADEDALARLAQFMHYFANMTQLPHPMLRLAADSG